MNEKIRFEGYRERVETWLKTEFFTGKPEEKLFEGNGIQPACRRKADSPRAGACGL